MLFKNNISQAKLIDEKWFGIVKNTWGRGGPRRRLGEKEWEIGREAGEPRRRWGRKGMGDRRGTGGPRRRSGEKEWEIGRGRRNAWLDWKMCK